MQGMIRASAKLCTACAFAVALCWMPVAVEAGAAGNGIIVYTQRFDGPQTIVNEIEWTYVRATPSLGFSNHRVIWTGVGAQGGAGEPPPGCPKSRLAGSDGLFYTPAGDLVVANWEPGRCALPGQFWKFDPTQTDVVLDGPESGFFAFHMLLHPNLEDFLATPALTGIACTDAMANPRGCFEVNDHTALTGGLLLCLAPLDTDTNDVMQPVTFIADGANNMFALFNEGVPVQFGGAGFASFDIGSTTSAGCGNDMAMKELLPVGLDAGHSISWDPFLSDLSVRGTPHSDFIIFANSKVRHIRVNNPGTPEAEAEEMSVIDMAQDEKTCASLLPTAKEYEFDQGAVTGDGIALVGEEHSGYLALIDYSQNTNGTILDGANTVCLTAHLHDHIDDIAPLTGLGAKPGFRFEDGFENNGAGGGKEARSSAQTDGLPPNLQQTGEAILLPQATYER